MSSRAGSVVHVTVEDFLTGAGGRLLDELVALTDRFDRVLSHFGTGDAHWERPAADEAVLAHSGSPAPSERTNTQGGLAIRGPWGDRQHPFDWATELHDSVRKELGLECSIGIAATRVAARICSRLARPRGILVWLEGYENTLVSQRPVEELDELRPSQLARLRGNGVRTLGDMAQLSPETGRKLLGSEASKLMGLVQGSAKTDVGVEGSRVQRAVGILCRRMSARLEESGCGARGLELAIEYEDGVVRQRYTLLGESTDEYSQLRASASRLVRILPERPQSISHISLTATGLTVGRGQLALFHRGPPRELVVQL